MRPTSTFFIIQLSNSREDYGKGAENSDTALCDYALRDLHSAGAAHHFSGTGILRRNGRVHGRRSAADRGGTADDPGSDNRGHFGERTGEEESGRLTEKPVKLGEASRSRHSGIPVQTERLKY